MSVTADLGVLRPHGGVVVVECKGEHDLTGRKRFDALLLQVVGEAELVVVDVSEAEFVDSAFLHSLVKANRAASLQGSRLKVQLGQRTVARSTFEASGLIDHLDCVETRAHALAADLPSAE